MYQVVQGQLLLLWPFLSARVLWWLVVAAAQMRPRMVKIFICANFQINATQKPNCSIQCRRRQHPVYTSITLPDHADVKLTQAPTSCDPSQRPRTRCRARDSSRQGWVSQKSAPRSNLRRRQHEPSKPPHPALSNAGVALKVERVSTQRVDAWQSRGPR